MVQTLILLRDVLSNTMQRKWQSPLQQDQAFARGDPARGL